MQNPAHSLHTVGRETSAVGLQPKTLKSEV